MSLYVVDPAGTVDLPIIEKKKREPRSPKYPFATMENVKDSFFVPQPEGVTLERLRKRLAIAGSNAKKGTVVRFKAVIREVEDGDPGGVGVRVMRVK